MIYYIFLTLFEQEIILTAEYAKACAKNAKLISGNSLLCDLCENPWRPLRLMDLLVYVVNQKQQFVCSAVPSIEKKFLNRTICHNFI